MAAHYQAQTNTPMVDRAWLLPRNPVTACRLALPMLQPDQIKDTLHAYQVSKRGNSLLMGEAVRWGRIAQLKDVREKVLTDLALLKRDTPSFRKISPTQMAYACRRMNELLQDRESGYGKRLLGLLLDEVRVEGRQATLKGSSAALDHLTSEMKMGNPAGVPRFVLDWRARQDSNL